MRAPRPIAAACFAVLSLAACGGSQKKAVEQAIHEHLNQNTHLIAGSFNTKIESVTVHGDSADALVRFESKQSAQNFVEVYYGLRLEDSHWEVVTSQQVNVPSADSQQPRDQDIPAAPGAEKAPRPQPSH
jgi:hypothetical protein